MHGEITAYSMIHRKKTEFLHDNKSRRHHVYIETTERESLLRILIVAILIHTLAPIGHSTYTVQAEGQDPTATPTETATSVPANRSTA